MVPHLGAGAGVGLEVNWHFSRFDSRSPSFLILIV